MSDLEKLKIEMDKYLLSNLWEDYSHQITYSVRNKETNQVIAFYPDGRIYGKTNSKLC